MHVLSSATVTQGMLAADRTLARAARVVVHAAPASGSNFIAPKALALLAACAIGVTALQWHTFVYSEQFFRLSGNALVGVGKRVWI